MEVRVSGEVTAPAAAIWKVFEEVCRWPGLISSYESIIQLSGEAFKRGSKYRLKLKGLSATDWTVIELQPGVGFVWESRRPGFQMYAEHWIKKTDDQSKSVVTLVFVQEGYFGMILGPFLKGKVQKMVELEFQGLKRAAEGTTSS
jgi:uncharacterized membrane protein